MEKIDNIAKLRKEIGWAIDRHEDKDFPIELDYHKSMEHPLFKIIIQKIDSNEFIDSTGQRWKKVS